MMGYLFAWLLYPFGVRLPTVAEGEQLLRYVLDQVGAPDPDQTTTPEGN